MLSEFFVKKRKYFGGLLVFILMFSLVLLTVSAKEDNNSVTQKDITFTVNDVKVEKENDKEQLTIFFTQKVKQGDIGEIEGGVELYVNDKPINFSSSSEGNFIDPKTYKGTMEILPTEKLPSKFTLDIKIYQIGTQKGEWFFRLPIES